MYEMVTYRKLFVESSRVKIREKIENFESAKYLQAIRNIKNEDVTPIIRLVIERFVMHKYLCSWRKLDLKSLKIIISNCKFSTLIITVNNLKLKNFSILNTIPPKKKQKPR